MSATAEQPRSGQAGFSLVETIIASGILATGLLSLAGVFALGLRSLAGSSSNLIAREKAREAIESVHTARDTRVITFAQINNVGHVPPGVFLDAATPLRMPGPDGLVNTADDTGIETMLLTGPDNILGTADDTTMSLTAFTRQIVITELPVPNPLLRQVRVIITYRVAETVRTYTLTTYVSSIS